MSGPAAYYGERTPNRLKMAAAEINNNGGFESKQSVAAIENGKIVPIKLK
ncbi:hypothetical protein ACFSLH_05835 [Saccharococcus thermophilus]|uniref:ABC-type branched-subunit amino acid transport system substrate-binding protein n=1 Tax=Saccharococcus thermophilus TaxID=29396 RepID=A0A846MFQ4_9BACL|nr:hypothetical protein [Saccharococcus thermophilus]NIK14699.1 ABC-type branched-subunit amino acid transport system substrate-binding protein [Saccharococcus thermophilus]